MEGRCLAGHEGRAWTRLLRPVLLPPAAEADAAFHPDGVPGSGGDGAEGDDGAVMLGIGPGSDALLALESAGAPVEVVEAVRAGARFVSGCIRFPRAGSRVQAGHASGSGDGDEAAAAAAAATAAAAAGGSSAGADDAETARLLANVLLPEAPASPSGAGHKQPSEASGRDMAALSGALRRLPAAAAARAWHAVSPLARFLLGVDVFVQANGFAMPGPATAVAHLDDGLVTVLLFSARFSGVKGLGATLRAMLALLRRGALPTLPVLVMATQTKSPGLAAAVQSAVAALPELAPFVRWQGYVPPSEAPLMVWAADVFVAPFLNPITETLGLAPLEAMALGRTVVHCAAGGMRDYTEPQAPARGARGGTGQGDVVASLPAWSGCDFEGVALAMDTALRGGPDFRRRVGQRARRVVMDNFSDDVWKPLLRAAYA
ncbi:hypothetical protein FNF29_06737 [Cafeteria roenbergensis]|nr:hypothetical protein FNF29_06737 [Cafeteria roenbergensis]KAA0161496.1 hypothetical protein FNF31_03779 [Cafeteria roenbergensis]|eukprot:KAA0148350.1 hypothetical protein FNF29_06737 [Cafeteria roenbergensis]